MKEIIKALLTVAVFVVLFIVFVGMPITELGRAYDNNAITGRLIARCVVMILIYKPISAFIAGFLKND